MVRKLKYHEQKLLRKVDFINWEADNNLHEVKVMKRFFVQKREDYTLYNKLSREIRDIVRMIKDLDPKSQHRTDTSAAFLEKMYSIGLIPTKWNLELCDKINASSFCRRRLPVVMVRSKMAENLRYVTRMQSIQIFPNNYYSFISRCIGSTGTQCKQCKKYFLRL